MKYDTVEEFRAKRDEAVNFIKGQTDFQPEYLIILGTGFGQLADEIETVHTLAYKDIPHFPEATVELHPGELIFGKLSGKDVVAMHGRTHYYEGYTMQQIVFPVRVAKSIGAQTLIVSNASGGLNPAYKSGDIMLITDHINFLGDNPLIGPNDDELGPRFPDMSEPYTERLLELAENVALEHAIKMHQGVYLSATGPMLETKAEYRYMRRLGADAVGMSTVPEVIAAVHMGMDVLGISVITDECFPDALEAINIEDIMAAAAMAEPKLTQVITEVLARL
ncbi:purine-nucleoside phosphorylase [Gracilimonas amylolytica]|uniref:purine-nucleoside phosphorylase n=1 Tax=Gracilimonas amylolytica TaxID=1749045 RepID=UPI000CD85224|nr:purine-nucleoside phosphorylase [Gracilimonas amylolytica]